MSSESPTGPTLPPQPHHFIPPDWFTDRGNSSIWLRIYTCLHVPLNVLTEALKNWPGAHSDKPLTPGAPFQLAIGTMTGFKVPVQQSDMFSPPSGQLLIAVNIDEKTLPDAIYVFLTTPFAVNGVPGNEPDAKARLDRFSGLVCAHTGLNFMRTCVFEGEIAVEDGKMTSAGPANRMPQPCEGPFLGQQNGEDVAEIFRALKDMPEPKKGRLELSLQLLNGAMRKNEGFLEYWTAIEVLCDGKSNRIKDRLGRVYGIKSQQEIARQSGLGVLTKWRGDYVHKGQPARLTSDIERYLQWLFLDLLRYELGLPGKGHAAAIQQTIGYDLSPLGLADNRTEEQKAAREAVENQEQRGDSRPGSHA